MSLIIRKKCPFCNNINFKIIYSLSYKNNRISSFIKKYYKNKIPKKINNFYYNLLECKKCTGIFQEQIPNKSFSFNLYENYISYKESLKKKQNFDIKNYKKYFADATFIEKLIKKKPKNISILDFGSGWGFWSKFINACNFKVKSYEISNRRINYLKKNKIFVLKNLKIIKEKFDFIYADQVFEHLPDPQETIKILGKVLKKKGYILLGFPSSFLFKYKLKKNYFPSKDCAHPLEHINILNRKCLSFMIKSTSLKIVNFKTTHNFSIKNLISDLRNLLIFNNVLLKK
jgi:2-polyprenyl-3-methyl-5-hydroxy-6-metoxy-1,4-benzoquinol methylase